MSRWVVVIALVLLPSIASADPVPTPQSAMENYFAGEKTGGYILIGMGAAGLATGGLLIAQSSQTLKGASYPLLGVGLLHVAAGIYINIASNGRIDEFTTAIDKDPTTWVASERERMRGVSTQFTVLKIVECVLIAGGLTAAVVGHKTDRPRLKGAGIALAIEMSATLAFDFSAAARAHDYRDELAAIEQQSSAPAPKTVMFVHMGVF
ncbi:MAG: hypothetical protein ACKV2T_40520 [Kofleriaceae bacterium]